MSGRKPLFDVESLEIGAKMELSGKAKKFKYQYNRNFNNRGDRKKKYILVEDGKKLFLERVA